MSGREKPGLLAGRTLVGVLIVLVATSPVWLANAPELWAPFPLYLTVAIWEFGSIAALLPAVAFAITFQMLARSDSFGIWVVRLALAAIAACVAWAVLSWGNGVQWMGLRHTAGVISLNLVGLLIVLVIALRGRSSQDWNMQYWATVSLFAVLAWCGIPYLGELP